MDSLTEHKCDNMTLPDQPCSAFRSTQAENFTMMKMYQSQTIFQVRFEAHHNVNPKIEICMKCPNWAQSGVATHHDREREKISVYHQNKIGKFASSELCSASGRGDSASSVTRCASPLLDIEVRCQSAKVVDNKVCLKLFTKTNRCCSQNSSR